MISITVIVYWLSLLQRQGMPCLYENHYLIPALLFISALVITIILPIGLPFL